MTLRIKDIDLYECAELKILKEHLEKRIVILENKDKIRAAVKEYNDILKTKELVDFSLRIKYLRPLKKDDINRYGCYSTEQVFYSIEELKNFVDSLSMG